MSMRNSCEKLRENLAEMERFKADIDVVLRSICEELEGIKGKWMGIIEKMERERETVVEEIEENAYFQDYHSERSMTNRVWSHCNHQSSQAIPVFSYSIQMDLPRLTKALGVTVQTSMESMDREVQEMNRKCEDKQSHFEGGKSEDLKVKLAAQIQMSKGYQEEIKHKSTQILTQNAEISKYKTQLTALDEQNRHLFDRNQVLLERLQHSEPRSEPISPTSLCHVENDLYKVFSIPLMKMTSVTISGPVPEMGNGTRYVWVESGLFFSGGAGSKKAYLLRVGVECEVGRLGDMRVARFAHGLWWDGARHHIVTFGGTFYPGFSTQCTS